MDPAEPVADDSAAPSRRDVGPHVPPSALTSPAMAMILEGRELAEQLEGSLQPLGLSLRKVGILGHLSSSPGASLTEVARRARITVASVHTIVAAMTNADLIRSGSGGGRGRRALLELTDTGEARMAEALRLIAELDRSAFDDASTKRTELGALLRAVTRERLESLGAPR